MPFELSTALLVRGCAVSCLAHWLSWWTQLFPLVSSIGLDPVESRLRRLKKNCERHGLRLAWRHPSLLLLTDGADWSIHLLLVRVAIHQQDSKTHLIFFLRNGLFSFR